MVDEFDYMPGEFDYVIPQPQDKCETCDQLTFAVSSKRCNRCWDIEHRLESYLRVGGVKAIRFVEQALKNARGE